MAEMALGYGSEYQLLRFLGHHREELEALIQNTTGVFEPIHWLDYPYDKERKSGDGELIGIECFQHLDNYQAIQEKWKSFWPQGGSSMNWDGIFIMDGVWYFVEAKANEKEAFQQCKAKSIDSRQLIDRAMNAAKEWIGIDIISIGVEQTATNSPTDLPSHSSATKSAIFLRESYMWVF